MATLKIENLTKTFHAHSKGGLPTRAIQDISFEMSGQVFVSLVGPSGCGKSTLLNIVSGVDTPSTGTVTVTQDGKKARLGYVFQDPRLLPWRTVMQNMLYVSDLHEEEGRANATKYLEMVGLEHAHEMYPGQLSGGMQQRVGIARAFSVSPDLLLMDEPFSHLDAITARSLREELQVMWNATKKTVLFVTHDVLEAVQLSNRIITLAHGGTVFDDTTVELPFPRKASDPDFAAHQAEILGRFEVMEAERAAAAG
ncbi:MAG: ABC transporter ATP-binding protein [Acidimicrobiia bacterium]|nr:ABC transporter ATP-binding protein [Acidimicrobiia bacterium]MDH3398344.1 ABC transporter ATP-binding protein [Acidimicrobiia bacterium]